MSAAPPNRRELAGWLIDHTRGLLPPLGISMLARIVGQLLGVALYLVAASAIVRAASGAIPPLLELGAWLVGLALAKAVLRYLEHFTGHWVAFAALQRLRELFFARLIPQAPAATRGAAGAELTGRATRDIDRIEVFFAHTFPPAVSAVVVPAVALGWLGLAVDARLAAMLAPAALLLSVVLPSVAGRRSWRDARRIARRRGEVTAQLGDDLQGIREVLAFGAAERRLEELGRVDAELVAARSSSAAFGGARTALAAGVQGLSLAGLLSLGAVANIPAPDVVLALAVAIGLWGASRGVDDFSAGLDAAFAATARIRRVVDGSPIVADPPHPLPAPEGPGELLLHGVSFRYPGAADGADAQALDAVELRAAPGEWSYLLGVSGSGKSTVASLLLRGWDPEAGEILLDGIPLPRLRLDELRQRIAVVAQRSTALAGSVAENLRLAAPDAPEEELREALHLVALDEWVEALPQGLDSPLGERGSGVSGGQLQRLALARALVSGPSVLVLDEALSQLDADTAGLVRERLGRARPGLTILEITHRADLIPDTAHVTVLDRGHVVAAGTASLLRADTAGPFARLEARV